MAIILSENLKWTGQRQNNVKGYLVSAEDIGFYKPDGGNYSLVQNKVLNTEGLITYISNLGNNLANNYYNKDEIQDLVASFRTEIINIIRRFHGSYMDDSGSYVDNYATSLNNQTTQKPKNSQNTSYIELENISNTNWEYNF